MREIGSARIWLYRMSQEIKGDSEVYELDILSVAFNPTRNSEEIFEQFSAYRLLNSTFSFSFSSPALLQFPEPRTPPQSP